MNKNVNQNKYVNTNDNKIENVSQNSSQSINHNQYIDRDRQQNMIETVSENENQKKKGHKRKHKDIISSLWNAVSGHKGTRQFDDASIESDEKHLSPQLERNRRKLDSVDNYSKEDLVMQVCSKNGLAYPKGTPINVTYFRPSVLDAEYTGPYVRTPYTIGTYATRIVNSPKESEVKTSIKESAVNKNEKALGAVVEGDEMMIDENGKSVKKNPSIRKLESVKTTESVVDAPNTDSTFAVYRREPIRFVYYTECDQVVRYDSEETVVALSSASNGTAIFIGRRREKTVTSAADDYMGGEIGS